MVKRVSGCQRGQKDKTRLTKGAGEWRTVVKFDLKQRTVHGSREYEGARSSDGDGNCAAG